MKANYYYTVNGEKINTTKEVNQVIRKMAIKPEVIKFESWYNGKTSQRIIDVKGSSEKINFTIL